MPSLSHDLAFQRLYEFGVFPVKPQLCSSFVVLELVIGVHAGLTHSLFKQMRCSLEVYVISLLYIERLVRNHFTLVNVYSIKQIVMTS